MNEDEVYTVMHSPALKDSNGKMLGNNRNKNHAIMHLSLMLLIEHGLLFLSFIFSLYKCS